MADALTPEEISEFAELKKIVDADGFMSLNTHEKRNRYRHLKAKDEGKLSEEVVTISKLELQDMMDKAVKKATAGMEKMSENIEGLEGLQRMGQWMKARDIKKANPTAKLRLYRVDGLSEPGIIIDWKFKENVFNEETRRYDLPIYHITVLYDDDEKKFYDIPLLNMIQINEFEEVEITKQDVEVQQMSQGKGQRAMTKAGYTFSNPAFFGTKATGPGEEFDYIVTRKEVTCTIKRPSGKTMKIDSSRLN